MIIIHIHMYITIMSAIVILWLLPLLPCAHIFRGEIPNTEKLLDKQDTITLKRCIYAAQRPHLPPIVTHNVDSDSTDPVLNHIRRVHLFNKREDRVKVRGEQEI